MAVTDEIERIQGAKADLKTSINAKNDAQHQITDETIDEYADFVDSIPSGGSQIEITDCYQLFYQNHRLSQLNDILPLCKPTIATEMFGRCTELTTIDLSSLDTSTLTDVGYILSRCSNLLTADMSNNNLSNVTKAEGMFAYSSKLETVLFPNITINLSVIANMFASCTNLVNINVDKINIGNIVTNSFYQNVFNGCTNLSNTSLNSILKMCSSLNKNMAFKTLQYIGLSQAQATTCQSLSNYQAFLDAGWTTGY